MYSFPEWKGILSFFRSFLVLFVELVSVVVGPGRQHDVYLLYNSLLKMGGALKLVEKGLVLCLQTCVLNLSD